MRIGRYKSRVVSIKCVIICEYQVIILLLFNSFLDLHIIGVLTYINLLLRALKELSFSQHLL